MKMMIGSFSVMAALCLACSPVAASASAAVGPGPDSGPNSAAVPDAAAVAAPGINHVYVVLDRATFDAIRSSDHLARLLGPPDGGLPDYGPPAADADRVFFRGQHSYIEFFAPENRFKEPVGKVGLALAHDHDGDFDALERTWRTICGSDLRLTSAQWRRHNPPVPWYEAIQCDGTASGPHLAVWAMIYRPEFHRWLTSGSPARHEITRRAVLAARPGAGEARFDVVGIEMELAAASHDALTGQLQAAGFQREEAAAGTYLRGDGWTLVLRKVSTPPRLASITLAVKGTETQGRAMSPLPLGSAEARTSGAEMLRLHFGRTGESRAGTASDMNGERASHQ
ncbi:MAG: DUF5829 family protein [Sphingopyxis sp.]|uniref:DUF5829 family protein n=1 Tax=Sphingopyxis sp. TaxID=1908224 RepID=UPI002ABBDD49|nr:DUF5829 family protein [Sphingopyxis sp.]MDZ3833747.1 DUF5829 family protein [Sphingopyxis sp.]